MAGLQLINEDGENAVLINMRNLTNAKKYIRERNREEHRKFTGRFKGLIIDNKGRVIN